MSWRVLHWAEKQSVKPCGAKFCLVMLANWSQGDGLAWGSQKRLAEATDQSASAVRKHLKALEAAGYIARYDRRDHQGRRKGDGYVLDPENAHGLLEQLGGERDVTAPGKLKTPVDKPVDMPVDKPANRQNQAVGPSAGFEHPKRQNLASQPPDSSATYSNAQSSPMIPPNARARDPAVAGGDAPAPQPTTGVPPPETERALADPWAGRFPGVKSFLSAFAYTGPGTDEVIAAYQDYIANKFDLAPGEAALVQWQLLREIHGEGPNGLSLKTRLLAKLRGAQAETLLLHARAAAEQAKHGGPG